MPRRLNDASGSVLLDQASLFAFISSSPRVSGLDMRIAAETNNAVREGDIAPVATLDNLKYVGVNTIADIEAALDEHGEAVVYFAKEILAESSLNLLSSGICMFYLCYVMVARNYSEAEVANYLETMSIGDGDDRDLFAKELVSTYLSYSNSS